MDLVAAARTLPRTEDLVLRLLVESDLERLVELVQDPEIPRWTTIPSPYGMSEALAWLARSRSLLESGASINPLIVDAVTGDLIGSVGYVVLRDEYGEIGYWIAASQRGRGICPRVVALMRHWGVEQLGLRTIDVIPHRDNAPSRRVAVKAGFVDTGELVAMERSGSSERSHAVYRWTSSR